MTPLIFILIVELILLAPLFLMAASTRRGNYRQAIVWARWNYATLGRILPSHRRLSALYIGQFYQMLGDFDAAQPYAEEAVAAYAKRGRRDLAAVAKSSLGSILTRQGQFAEAEVLIDEALTLPQMRPTLRAVVEINAATIYLNQGRIEEAARLLDPHVNAGRPLPDNQAIAMNNRSLGHYLEGEIAEAVALSHRATQQPVRNPMTRPVTEISHLFYLAEAGEIAAAQELEAKLMPQIPTLPPHLKGAAYRSVARLAQAMDRLDRARDFAERAAQLDINPNGLAGSLLILAEIFAVRHNAHRATALCDEILRSDAVPYYKRRAEALRSSLNAPAGMIKAQETTTLQQIV